MAATVRVRNLGPFDRDICPDRRDVLATVAVGASIEVSAALAGSAEPGPWVKADAVLEDGREYRTVGTEDKPVIEARTLPFGLLAQVDAWEIAPAVEAPSKKDEAKA